MVDGVILSADAMKQELFNVGASRGRNKIAIITNDHGQWRESFGITSARPSAMELAREQSHIPRTKRSALSIQFEKGSVKPQILGVREMIRETVALLRDEAMRYNISVRTELAADLPQIVGDRLQLQQVAMILIVNSIEAMKDVDGIRETVIKLQRADNEQILMSVSDTGVGFPPQVAEQVFRPFFTTKPHGTGMGLRISRSFIESHGGR